MRSAARRPVSRTGLVVSGVVSCVASTVSFALAQAQTGVAPTDEPVAVATRGAGQEPWVVIYDPPSRRIVFERLGPQGIERRGARLIGWDLVLEELNPRLAQSGQVPVSRVRTEAEKDLPAGVAGHVMPPGGRVALDAILGIVDEVFPIERGEVERAREICLGSRALSARDAVHLAVLQRHGIAEILTFDSGFDGIPGIRRIFR